MKYVVFTTAALYGLLHGLAAAFKARQSGFNTTAWMMLIGSALMIAALFLRDLGWIAALAGGALVCAAAMLNGKISGHFHGAHHVIRALITALIVVGFTLL